MVLVSGSSDLPLLSDYEPGTIAHTAGFTTMWQKSPSGKWVAFEQEGSMFDILSFIIGKMNGETHVVLDSDSYTYTDDGEGNITVEEEDNGN